MQLLSRERMMRRALAMMAGVAALSLVGCGSMPINEQARKVTTDDGANAINVTRLAGIVIVRTIGFVPGANIAETGPMQRLTCKAIGAKATVIWHRSKAITHDNARAACQWVLTGVAYIGQFLPQDRIPMINYRLYLVPAGVRAFRKSLSWKPLGSLRPLFAAHWYPDARRTEANIVNVYAHESVHLRAAILGLDSSNEPIAALGGECASLQSLGSLRLRDMQAAKPTKQMHLAGSVMRSAEATHDLFEALRPRLDKHGVIQRDSSAGRELAASCKKKLTAFFGGTG